MGIRVLVLLLVAVNEFLHGFALSFCAFMTFKNIFYREAKRFITFSLCSGVLLSAVITCGLAMSGNSGIDVTWILTAFVVFVIMLGWLFITNRSIDSLISIAFATAFSECTIKTVEKIISVITSMNNADSEALIWLQFLWYTIIYLLAPAFIIFLGFIVGNKEREPLSKWNMLILTGSVAAIIIVNTDEVIPIAVTFFFISVAVMLSVRNSQAQYYSKINHINEEYLAMQASHFEKVRASDIELRSLRHDMQNHVLCMNELCRQKQYDELSQYINSLSDRVNEISSVVRTGNEIADAVINEKSSNAAELKIQINIDGNFREIHIPAIDLCTILSNLFDNAIEAVKELDEPERKISISTGSTGNFIFLSFENNTADYIEISDKTRTAKKDWKNHGFGIENVRRAVSKCGGEIKFECVKRENNYVFMAEVMLPRKF